MTAPPAQERGWHRHIPAAVLIIIPCVLIGPALVSERVLYGIDMFEGSFAIREVVARSYREGRLPTWDPHVMCGFPIQAAVQSAILYPLSWPAMLMPIRTFWEFTVLVHMILSGLFAYAWIRHGLGASPWGATSGALAFMLSGFFSMHIYAGHIGPISSYPWLVATLWQTERILAKPILARGALLSAVVALLVLSGFSHFLLIAFLAVSVRVVCFMASRRGSQGSWKACLIVVLALSWGLLLSAPQLLPTLELMPLTHRVNMGGYGFTTSYSMPPENLITFLAPGVFGDSISTPYRGRWVPWEVRGYAGVASLVLAAFGAAASRGRLRWLWLGMAAAGVLLALGGYTIVFKVFCWLVPGASLFRAPARYLALFCLSIAPLLAAGVDALLGHLEASRPRLTCLTRAVGALLLLTAGIVVLALIAGPASPTWQPLLDMLGSGDGAHISSVSPPAGNSAGRGQALSQAVRSLGWACIVLLAIFAALLAATRRWIRERTVAWLLMGCMAAELIVFFWKNTPVVAQPQDDWPTELAVSWREDPSRPFRIVSGPSTHSRDVARCQARSLDHVGGYEPMRLTGYAEVTNVLAGLAATEFTEGTGAVAAHPFYDMLGGKVWILDDSQTPKTSWKQIGQLGNSRFYESPDAFPRAFLVPEAELISDRNERLQRLVSPDFSPDRKVLIESGQETLPRGVPGGSVTIQSRTPGHYTLDVETPGGSYLLLTESYFPGWRAEVDGRPARILKANHFLQAVWMPPGRHRMEFNYQSTYLNLGFTISGTALAFLIGLVLANRIRSARCASRPPVTAA